jgi:DNA (cytosine-5)-methyltransferase 1
MTKLTEQQLENEGPISLLVGGTPCQSFSVAGLRKGLEDPRGNLALRFTQLVGVLRPTWVVWENVPGVLSSAGGRDFGTFLGALAELGYGFAYRVLDAQWFGVAQRRRRVFVVAHARDWRCAAAVLFERESVFGNPPTRGSERETTAISPALRAQSNSSHREDTQAFVPQLCPALKARDYKGPSSDGDGDGDGASLVPIAFKANMSTPSYGHGVAETLQAENQGAVAFTYSGYSNQPAWMTCDRTDCLPSSGHSDGSHQGVGVIAFDGGNQSTSDDIHHTLRIGRDSGDAVYFEEHFTAVRETQVAPAMTTEGYKISQNAGALGLRTAMSVRRLTPRECERLQGFPDDYTLVTYRNKPAADGPRYKALGNSMAVPVMRWIGERIASVDSLNRATA